METQLIKEYTLGSRRRAPVTTRTRGKKRLFTTSCKSPKTQSECADSRKHSTLTLLVKMKKARKVSGPTTTRRRGWLWAYWQYHGLSQPHHQNLQDFAFGTAPQLAPCSGSCRERRISRHTPHRSVGGSVGTPSPPQPHQYGQ